MYIPFLFYKHKMIPQGFFFFNPPTCDDKSRLERTWGLLERIQIGDDNSNIYSLFSQQLTSRKKKSTVKKTETRAM